MSAILASRRARLTALLLVSTAAISVLAISAATGAFSLYVTPEEFRQQLDTEGKRWRVGGRVDGDTIVRRNGAPVRFEIVGEGGERMSIAHESGGVPSLFGPGAFVLVEGEADGAGGLIASSVTIKHENEFFAETATPSRAP